MRISEDYTRFLIKQKRLLSNRLKTNLKKVTPVDTGLLINGWETYENGVGNNVKYAEHALRDTSIQLVIKNTVNE